MKQSYAVSIGAELPQYEYKRMKGRIVLERIIFMYKHFLSEPVWFKLLIITALLAAIIFSSSWLPDNGYYQSIAKLAAAIFFTAYGVKFRSNTRVSVVFFGVAVLSIILAWINFDASHM